MRFRPRNMAETGQVPILLHEMLLCRFMEGQQLAPDQSGPLGAFTDNDPDRMRNANVYVKYAQAPSSPQLSSSPRSEICSLLTYSSNSYWHIFPLRRFFPDLDSNFVDLAKTFGLNQLEEAAGTSAIHGLLSTSGSLTLVRGGLGEMVAKGCNNQRADLMQVATSTDMVRVRGYGPMEVSHKKDL
ncbi:MAG: hypothetical protein Q9160_005336 [Pyrenula sp. 1 TL-2023]